MKLNQAVSMELIILVSALGTTLELTAICLMCAFPILARMAELASLTLSSGIKFAKTAVYFL